MWKIPSFNPVITRKSPLDSDRGRSSSNSSELNSRNNQNSGHKTIVDISVPKSRLVLSRNTAGVIRRTVPIRSSRNVSKELGDDLTAIPDNYQIRLVDRITGERFLYNRDNKEISPMQRS